MTAKTQLHIYKYIPWFIVFLWMVLIFTLSSISAFPGPRVFLWDFILKKSAHMFMFGILFFLTARAVNQDRQLQNWNFTLVFFITIVYAFSDEFHQSFTIGRSAQLMDVGYDSLGAFISYIYLNKLLL